MKLASLLEYSNNQVIYQDEHGYIKGHLRPDGYWWIEKFFIYPEYRGQGFAKDLAGHIPQKAKLLAQPLKVKGEVILDRDPLINFYKSLGFEEQPDSNDNMYMVRENLKLTFTNSLNEEIDFEESQLPNGKPIVRFSDEVGGSGFLTINNGIATIIDWHSIPSNKRYSDDADSYKNRGFAVSVILAIKNKLHINTVKVSMPSGDAVKSLNKMVEKGILTPHEDSKMGISTNQYYTVFEIN